MSYHEVERLRGELNVHASTLIEDRRMINLVCSKMRQSMEVIQSYQPFNYRDEYMQELFALAGYTHQLEELLRNYAGTLAEYRQTMAQYTKLVNNQN